MEASRDDGYVKTDHRFRPLDEPRAPPSRLRELVREGRYEVDPRAVAETIVRSLGRSARPD